MMNTGIHWFRRDLRWNDNTALNAALKSGCTVLPVFIFDTKILSGLISNDARVNFIYQQLAVLREKLNPLGSDIKIYHGQPEEVWQLILHEFKPTQVFFNHDSEPYALERDRKITELLAKNEIRVHTFKDHVFFEKSEVVKPDGSPYTVYTPYKNKWLEKFRILPKHQAENALDFPDKFFKAQFEFPSLAQLGFSKTALAIPAYNVKGVKEYHQDRDFPAKNASTHLGHHLRFGTVSIRALVEFADARNQVFLSELIWRDFFSQILHHFPHVVGRSFKPAYDKIKWDNDKTLFEKWCNGVTGYPLVDAGMHELNQTGFMHNRVRMVTASFLVKHLLIDWRWGEAYFAEKLLDFDLASNNGNWQWVAGCGCDAAPYFRIFNPSEQQKKFDPEFLYIKKWLPEFHAENYIPPIVDHVLARKRSIARYQQALGVD